MTSDKPSEKAVEIAHAVGHKMSDKWAESIQSGIDPLVQAVERLSELIETFNDVPVGVKRLNAELLEVLTLYKPKQITGEKEDDSKSEVSTARSHEQLLESDAKDVGIPSAV